MEEIILRTATPSDAPLLTSLEAACFPDAWGEGAVGSHLAAATSVSLIAETSAGPLGYLLGLCLPPEGELLRVAVLPPARRRGVGALLLQGFLDILDKNHADICFLEVRESNLAARSLYEAHGFRLVGARRNYYKDPKEDAFVMQRG